MSILNSTNLASPTYALPLKSALKRKRAHDQTSSDVHLPSSQSRDTKRIKLDFKTEVQTIFYEPDGEDSAAFVQSIIRTALKEHVAGDDDRYSHVKAIFQSIRHGDEAPSITTIRKFLLGLSNCASSLNRQCSSLVHAVIDMAWLDLDDISLRIYVRFLASLVSAQTGWITPVLRMLVASFTNPCASTRPNSQRHHSDHEMFQDRVHDVLGYLLTLVPSASSCLAFTLATMFPATTDSRKIHVDYIRNVLRVADYARELKAEILDLITEKLIKIDVQVQLDVDDLDEMVDDLLAQNASESVVRDDGEYSETESISSGESLDPEEERLEALKRAVQKMDSIMDVLFTYYDPSFQRPPQHESRRMFNQMLAQFRTTILPTHRSRHTQFLLFHFAQKSPEMLSSFIETCLQIATDRSQSLAIRISSAAYIASFVARGRRVKSDTVTLVFDTLGAYVNRLRSEYEPSSRGPDLRRYSIYYAAIQALIYIFCFRWRDLLRDPDDQDVDDDLDTRDLVWLPGVKETFQQNFTSKLNPLKICVPEIVEQFAYITHQLQFLYVHHIIESNKRLRLTASITSAQGRGTSLTGLVGEHYHQLEAYFPFDPYQLPISKRWLAEDYNEWKDVPGMRGSSMINMNEHAFAGNDDN